MTSRRGFFGGLFGLLPGVSLVGAPREVEESFAAVKTGERLWADYIDEHYPHIQRLAWRMSSDCLTYFNKDGSIAAQFTILQCYDADAKGFRMLVRDDATGRIVVRQAWSVVRITE